MPEPEEPPRTPVRRDNEEEREVVLEDCEEDRRAGPTRDERDRVNDDRGRSKDKPSGKADRRRVPAQSSDGEERDHLDDHAWPFQSQALGPFRQAPSAFKKCEGLRRSHRGQRRLRK